MATKYTREQLLFLWVAGGHTEASFTDAVYKYLTAAQGGPPEPAPTPAPRPVAVRAQPKSSPKPVPKRAPKLAPKPAGHNKQWPPVVEVLPPGPVFTPAPPTTAVVLAAAASSLTLYKLPISPGATDIIIRLLSRARAHHASVLVANALIYAVTGESGPAYDVGVGGPLQTTCNLSAYDSGRNIEAQADSWLFGGECFAKGGIAYSAIYSTAWQIAGATEENAVWGASKGDSYTYPGRPSSHSTTAELTAEVERVVQHYYGGKLQASFTPPSGPNTSVGGAFSDQIKHLNWAGNMENVIKSIMGGSNQASHMAQVFAEDELKIEYVNYT